MIFPLYFLFVPTLVLGSVVALNASSWLVAWVGLEMNLLSFLPIMASEGTKGSSESCVKYFLVQSMASLMILVSSVFVFVPILSIGIYPIFVGLSIKLGAAPFHFWFPVVMEGVSWSSCLVLATWQKLAPLFLMSFVEILLVLVIFTVLVGAFGGFSQTSLRKLIAFSSVNHVGWMLAGLLWGIWVGLIYYWVYFVLLVLIILGLSSWSVMFMSQVGSMSFFFKMFLLTALMSLGGLPPFLGFFPKWFVIESFLHYSLSLSLILILSSLVSLYFYLRLVYPSLLMKYVGSEAELGGTSYVATLVAFFFLSSGGVFCYPLLSVM